MKEEEIAMKKLVSVLLAAVMILTLVACGGDTKSSETTKDTSSAVESSEKASLSLKMSGHPYIHAVPTIYAGETGIWDEVFEDWSYDVYASGPVQNEAIASGSWEAGTTGMGGLITGAPAYNLKAIGFTTPDTQTVRLMVRPDSELATMEPDEKGVRGTADDWRGKTIFCATGTVCHMLLSATLEHLGLTADDINLVDTSVPNSYATFIAGEGDLVCIWDPFSFQYEAEGGVTVANCVDLGLNMPAIIVATEEALTNNREAVVTFLDHYLELADQMNADPELCAEWLTKYQNEQGITTNYEDSLSDTKLRPFVSYEENLELFTPGSDGVTPAETILLDFADFLIAQGKLTEADKEKMIENDFVDYSVIQDVAARRAAS